MPLRMLEAIVPREALPGLAESLADAPAVGVWTFNVGDDQGMLRVLVEAERTEALTDDLASRFSNDPRFRVVLYPVEATLPTLDEEVQEAEGAATPPDGASGREVPGLREASEVPGVSQAPEGSEVPGAADVPEGVEAPSGQQKPDRSPLRISREELHQDVSAATRISTVYLITVALSTLVAAVGITGSNVAVVIGAMVIAPLLGPNLALGLGAALGDIDLITKAMRASAVGVAVALSISIAIGALWPYELVSDELLSRCAAGLDSAALALASGAAAALSITTGLPSVLVGVMVAVALLPPTATAGIMLGQGELELALGATLLLAVNIVCVNLAAKVVFLLKGIRPRTWYERARARRAMTVYILVWFISLVVLLFVIVHRYGNG